MNKYISREDVLDSSNIITVQTKEYGIIEVIPVDTIADIELADAQPVKYGRWIDDKTCSNCGFDILYNYGISGTKHCPDCGADMRGDPDV